MRNLYIKSMLTALLLLYSTVASAHDFEVGGIYYNITDATAKTVEVTYSGSYYHAVANEYTGAVTIPSTVIIYNGTTYSVTSIDNYAFYGCTGLTSVTIGNSVTSIGDEAFYGCTGLTSVTIGNSVTSIGEEAFYGCSGLTRIIINSGSIGDYAFYGCSGLTSVTIGSGVTSIGERVFEGCTKLASVTIGNSVTSIGSKAFYGCSRLASVTIGNSVTSIGEGAFEGCSGLTAVHINDLAAWCRIDFSNFSSNPLSYAHNLYLNGKKVTNLVFPSDITEIKKYAFRGCSGLTSVTIGNSVTSIGSNAFYGCSDLKFVTIGNSVTSIGSYAFSGCSGLRSVVIPSSVTSIGGSAFYGCTGLKSVYNNSSLNIFKGREDYGYVAYYADRVLNHPYFSVEGNFIFGVIDDVIILLEYIGNGGDITLPTNYKGYNYVIGSYAFAYCTGLTGVTIPNGVTGIGDNAFANCI